MKAECRARLPVTSCADKTADRQQTQITGLRPGCGVELRKAQWNCKQSVRSYGSWHFVSGVAKTQIKTQRLPLHDRSLPVHFQTISRLRFSFPLKFFNDKIAEPSLLHDNVIRLKVSDSIHSGDRRMSARRRKVSMCAACTKHTACWRRFVNPHCHLSC